MKTKQRMRNLLKYSKFLILALLISCTETEVPPMTPASRIEKLTINTDIDYGYWGTSGASGYFNDFLFVFGYSDYSKAPNNDFYGISCQRGIWFEDVQWANREDLVFNKLNLQELEINDTLNYSEFVTFLSDDPLITLFNLYSDGDAGAESCSVFDGEYDSRLIITEKDFANNVIAGNVNAKISLNDLCPPKYDPSKPDEYIIRDFNFRARLR
jgi:hypothetical protein